MWSNKAVWISFTTITGIVVGQILSLISIGCARVPDLPDLFRATERGMPFDVRLQIELAAPLIVVGLVEGEDEVGHPRRSRGDPRLGIQLTRVRVRAEQVLRGAVPRGALTFYYYAFSYHSEAEPPRGIKRYHAYPGQRYIFFLQPFPGGYRSIGDVTDYTLQVWGGRHTQDFCRGKSVGCCIAEILLVPGEEYDGENFARYLWMYLDPAKMLCSQERALELVQSLERHPDRVVSRAATEALRPWRTYGDFP